MPPRRNRPAEESRRLSPDELDQVVRFRLADVAADDLSKKVSEPDALRKALLVLIALTADGADEPARQFTDYLLTHFTPLAAKFEGQAHPLWQGHSVTRARDPGGVHLRLALREGLVEALLKGVPGVGRATGS
jgi:hypothetical protein